MTENKVGPKVEKAPSEDLKKIAEVKRHLEDSIAENQKLGRLLGR
jgi:hypothetical protein